MERTKSRFMALLLVVVMMFSAMPMTALTANAATASGNTTEFAGGSGTEEDPYLISTKKQLYNVRNYPSAYFLQKNDIAFADADFTRGGDFYNGGYGWEAFDFSGSYDGGNYKIENLQGIGGLFANLSGAKVKNIDLCAYIRCADSSFYTFGVLGWNVSGSEISNCAVSGVLGYKNSTASYGTDFHIGAICGESNDSTIQFCTNNMEMVLSVVYPDFGYYDVYTGGICGAITGNSTIFSCKNYSNFDDYVNYPRAMGGIVGYGKSCAILNCTNYGAIIDEEDAAEAGGIVGGLWGGTCTVADCTNYGTIYSEISGGICGSAQSGSSFTNCNNFGQVESGFGQSRAGGICGESKAEVSKCSNFAVVYSYIGEAGGIIGYGYGGKTTDCINQGAVYASNTAGGITGESYSSNDIINDCYNLGNVEGDCSGGICGKASYGIVQRCYNTGAVNSSSIAAGGIVGINAASVKDCYNVGKLTAANADVCLGGVTGKLSGEIDCCYNIGTVEQVGNFGGICGKNDNQDASNITNCFFLREDNLYSVGMGYGDATALSMDEMRLPSSFSGFDFDSVWTMAGNEEYLYPELKSNEHKKDHKTFDDVVPGSFYYEPVMWAAKNGVTSGTSATTFDPSGLCLRAHVVTFLYRAAGSPVPSTNKNPFTDVKSGDFYYNPVLWAVENGITQGISKNQFGSTQVCNRAAVVTFLWRAFGSPEPKSTNNPFVDVKNTDFFYKPVLWAVENGITAGIDATHFNPAGACNRAQVVTFLYRAYN